MTEASLACDLSSAMTCREILALGVFAWNVVLTKIKL